MSTIAENTVNETQQKIDQEIEKLKDQIRALKSRRNTLAPISRLPPEILSKAFALTISDPLRYDALNWVKVSHVSQHWREVALECPSLWVNLVFSRPKWCQEMLTRSKMAGLIIKADLERISFRNSETVRLAMLQGPRIREIELHASYEDAEKLVCTDPPLRLPMIRSFTFLAPLYHKYPERQPTLLKCILDNDTPQLRCLNLRQSHISWDTSLFNGLTSLTIHEFQASSRPTIDELLNTLKRMSALEVLDLKNALPPLPPGTPATPAENKISLSRLTDLVLNSTLSECLSLVGQIKIPATARINITCKRTQASDVDFSVMVGMISSPDCTSAHMEDGNEFLERRIIHELRIKSGSFRDFVLSGWYDSHSPGAQPTPDIQLSLSCSFGSLRDPDSTVTKLCNAIYIEHILDLHFSHWSGITRKTWEDTFGILPQLHSVHVVDMATYTLVSALGDPQPAIPNNANPTTPPMYFPNMEYLTIEACDFHYMSLPGSRIETLRECMKYRSNHMALQELCLRDCFHLYDDDVDLLKEVVDVVWDGVVNEDSSSGSDSNSDSEEVDTYVVQEEDLFADDFDYLY